jgi:hypothetical protein
MIRKIQLPLALLLFGCTAFGQSNIDAGNKYAWCENVGWTNWLDADSTNQGGLLHDDHLEGFIWGENIGWINLGNGGGPYGNDAVDFGVNMDVDSNLSGLAWGENVGWFNFGWADVSDPLRPRFDRATGQLRGYVWGENIGWVNLDHDTYFVALVCFDDVGDLCTNGIGECEEPGDVICSVDGFDTVCDAVPGTPEPELCDCLDNDCDGVVDNGNPGGGELCDSGEPGICMEGTTDCQVCVLVCTPNQTPFAELCNGLDDDCNGAVDNGNPEGGLPCATGLFGICDTGTTECQGGAVVCVPNQTAAPDDSLCNGLDDDCNGQVDEDYVSLNTNCGVGACAATGVTSCVAGVVEDSCMEGAPADDDATCDAVDDDCDGMDDEDYVIDDTCGGLCTGTFTPNSCVDGGEIPCSPTPGGCDSASDCGDCDDDGVIDDACFWYECIGAPGGTCSALALVDQADMGGPYGECQRDTFCNIHDRTHALSCFAGTNPCDPSNIDAGGAFGACPRDGFCNIHDANHALSCFAGTNSCICSAPMPEFDPVVVGEATLHLVGSKKSIRPGGEVEVRVFIDGPVEALRSYQLDVNVTGGKAGALDLVDITIESRKDSAFTAMAGAFDAFNTSTGQMLSGLDQDNGVTIRDEAYLATFTYRASGDALGQFMIDVASGIDSQTYLVAPGNGQIRIQNTEPAVVTVSKRR